MADEAAVVDEGISPAQSPLVTITFQRNSHRREKYLEAEPKALGITQIGLSVYMMVSLGVFLSSGLSDVHTDIPFFISSPLTRCFPVRAAMLPVQLSLVSERSRWMETVRPDFGLISTFFHVILLSVQVVIAGSTAVAAQNLHLPTLRACLGMQIVACVASVVNILCTVDKVVDSHTFCWHELELNTTYHLDKVCYKAEKMNSHFFAGGVLIQTALFAISATLAAYCCKVVNCCGPPAKMPVITVQAPPAQE